MHKLWSLLFGLVSFAALALFVMAYFVPGWWLPLNVSTFGHKTDNLFYLILWITAFFFVLTEAILVYNIYRFGAPDTGHKVPYIHGSHKLELIWTIVPAGILVLIAILQIGTWEEIKYGSKMPKPDGTVCQMVVVARQWEWRVRYPNWNDPSWQGGDTNKSAEAWARLAEYPYEDYPQFDDIHDVNAIHCWMQPNDTEGKVLIHLRTRDVLHSFFLPNLRIKQDAVPGKSIRVWFALKDYNCIRPDPSIPRWVDGYNPRTQKTGDAEYVWDLACAEYCGVRHSMMKGRLYVHKDRADFMEWLKAKQKEQQERIPHVANAG